MFVVFFFTQFNLADSLFNNKYFDLAEIEYKRLFFFDSNLVGDRKMRLNHTISVLHTNPMRGYEEAQRLLNNFAELDEESKINLGISLGECGFHSFAIEVLSQTGEKKWTGYYCLLNGQYNKARTLFLEANAFELVQELDCFNRIFLKSPVKAMLMSVLVPGTGELYAGNLRLAVFDFLLTAGSGYLFYNAVRGKKYVDAGLILSIFFNRFYFGSISNAGRTVQKKNEENRKKWLAEFRKKYFNK
ncbi:MAG: hypothetical protein ABIL70_07000 [candidate division WOR-3 bacterium]